MIRHRRPRPRRLGVLLAFLGAAGAGLALQRHVSLEEEPSEPYVAAPPTVDTEAQRWRKAAKRVEEDRGEPMGRAARVTVPTELRHYRDTRRFLAVQVAAAREQDLELPHDDAALVELIERDGFVELPPLGDHYILYGVGANASEGPLVHVDPETRASMPLFPRYDLAEDAAYALQAEAGEQTARAAQAAAQVRRTKRTLTRRRRALANEAGQARARAASLSRQARAILTTYRNEERRRMLVGEWQTLHAKAASFPDRRYDLDDPRQRRAFRARLLSFLRPPARDLALEIARDYHERFDRPLALTSLVRTVAYQRQLGETNPNATRIDVPPHTTGLAFDVYYRYMDAEEQAWLMERFAELEADGRLEALREQRDHIHALVFPTGQRPPEALIAEAIRERGRPAS